MKTKIKLKELRYMKTFYYIVAYNPTTKRTVVWSRYSPKRGYFKPYFSNVWSTEDIKDAKRELRLVRKRKSCNHLIEFKIVAERVDAYTLE
jgi:hypothetical protein